MIPHIQTTQFNKRQLTLVTIVVTIIILLVITISGLFIGPSELGINLQNKSQSPSLRHLFGTDWLGRDMFARTLKGLTLSFRVGLFAAIFSVLIALIFSLLSSWSKVADGIITWVIDLFLSIPHIVSLILISFVLGGGGKGVVIGIALTHWPSLARLLRAEILQIKSSEYINVSTKLGKSFSWIVIHHYIPNLMPQLFVGLVLLFPHAILHEAAITFLGFGLSTESPAIGIILSESMQYLSTGMWWLACFPGLSLLIMISAFELLGKSINRFIHPYYGR